jgi:hypothetical protein
MPSYRFRDKTTGLFYKGIDYNYINYHKAVTTMAYASPRKGKAPTKAELGKEFKDMGKAKNHLLYLTGHLAPPEGYNKLEQELIDCRKRLEQQGVSYREVYKHPDCDKIQRRIDIYEATHPGYFNLPEWLYNPYPTTVPNTWELVAINTETLEQTVVDFDPQEYLSQQRKYRDLIDRFGQSVKDVYKKVEKKGVDVFSDLLVIGPDFNRLDEKQLWQLMEYPEPETTKIDETFGNLVDCEITKKDYIRATAGSTTTIAFKDVTTMVHFRLAYTGKYNAYHIDARKMVEVAE